MTEIVDITAREILDSRGNPTVEVDVESTRMHALKLAITLLRIVGLALTPTLMPTVVAPLGPP